MTVQEPLLLLRQQLAPVGCGVGVLLGLEQVLPRVVVVVEVVDVARHGTRRRRRGGGRVATLAAAAFEHRVAGIRALNYQKCHKGEVYDIRGHVHMTSA